MYLVLIALPLFSYGSLTLMGRFLGRSGACFVSTACLVLSFVSSAIVFFEVGLCQSVCFVKLAPWFDVELFRAGWGFLFDSSTAMMLVVVTGVSSLVHLYSNDYMSDDPHQVRFMSYLSLFTFFMLLLVTGDNFMQMFLGWEGVGLASYLLINFWYTRLQANKSAIKAMVMNRIGDFGLALGLCSVFFSFRSVEYPVVFSLSPLAAGTSFGFLGFQVDCLTASCILMFVGSVGKSAQIGLHTWLPDAMEGPTPVSALIHAATMVTAGVFLLLRCSPVYEFAPVSLVVVTVFGSLTAFFAATTGLVQHDLKRVIAFSTCSQLGYMVFACGLSSYTVGFFHLANHAVFKALLFLSAGSLIHGLCDEQDMRRMGGLVRLFPLTYAMMLIGSLALIGFPFLTGFYSKDAILECSYAHFSLSGCFANWLGTVSACFTAFYSFRLTLLGFLNESNSFRPYVLNAHEASPRIAIPLVILALGSIFVGYLTRDLVIGLGSPFWGNALFIHPEHVVLPDAEFIPTSVKLIPLVCTFSGSFMSLVLVGSVFGLESFSFRFRSLVAVRKAIGFLSKKWYFDQLYNQVIASLVMRLGYFWTFRTIDKGIIEMLGPFGISWAVYRFSRIVSWVQTGFLYHYTFVVLTGVAFAIGLSSVLVAKVGSLLALALIYCASEA
uniref:NADH-ubiquinone oxidoreductase chain 5 n=1 Tax=Haptophyceae sp. NIES-3900 TaxID=2748608 RepID=A0A7R7AHM0_9EUKA|nr:NADH dehydrogenase subunit 5 [Haptophyceae sp. NIES-3900]